MLLKKNVYDCVGGFDERYFMYGEYIDLSYSVLNAGYDNYYYGKTTIVHFKGESTLKDEVYAKRFYGAMQLFYKKHFKANLFFDIIVKLGVSLIPLFKSVLKEKVNDVKPEYVLETAELTYKEIIQLIEKKKFYYNIHVENTNFTIGSKSSKSRGEVVLKS